VLADHTYVHRVELLEQVLDGAAVTAAGVSA
jgi:hypothetical protein